MKRNNKGQFLSNSNLGDKNYNWKGGKTISPEGYIEINMPSHHRAKQNGFVYEHILVAEKKYGKEIYKETHIHHLNGIKNDNRPENLVLRTNATHDKFSVIHDLQSRIRELEKTAPMYKRYFTQILNLVGKGWYHY